MPRKSRLLLTAALDYTNIDPAGAGLTVQDVAAAKRLTGKSFENWTKRDASLMLHVELEFDNRADVEALREPFRQFVENDEDVIDPEDAACQVVGQNARAMIVRFLARSSDPKRGWAMHCRLREHMLKAAAELDGISSREPGPAYFAREREVVIEPAPAPR